MTSKPVFRIPIYILLRTQIIYGQFVVSFSDFDNYRFLTSEFFSRRQRHEQQTVKKRKNAFKETHNARLDKMGLYRVNKRGNIIFCVIFGEIITEKMAILSEMNKVIFVRRFFGLKKRFILDGSASQDLIPISLSIFFNHLK